VAIILIFPNITSRSAASTIMSIVYDHPPIKSEDEPSVVRINDFVERIVRAAYPGAHLVEFFPWMRYLPEWMAKWKREAMKWYRHDSTFFVGLYNNVQKRVVRIRKISATSVI
jgi:hypothetical protein